jgi:hypothetical protein
MNSRMFANGSFWPLKSARRNATVTISAPLTLSASRMASGDENFPVPMNQARTETRARQWSMTGSIASATTHNHLRKCVRFVEATDATGRV